jgi:hypothetical protein
MNMTRAPNPPPSTRARRLTWACLALSTQVACAISNQTAEVTERELDGSAATMTSADGLLEARFAAGALPGPTTVRIVIERGVEDLDRLTPVYRLEPDGLAVNAPIELRVRPARAGVAELLLAEVTEGGTVVDEASSLDPGDGRVVGRVSRFARYAVLQRGTGCPQDACGAACGTRGRKLCTASGQCVAPAVHPGCGGDDGGVASGDGGFASGDGGGFSGDGGFSGEDGGVAVFDGSSPAFDGSTARCDIQAPPLFVADEVEQGDALAVPQAITTMHCAVSRVRAAFDAPNDVDAYIFDVPAGYLASIELRVHSSLLDVDSCDGSAIGLDVRTAFTMPETGASRVCPREDLWLEPGRYRVLVSDGEGRARDYALSIFTTYSVIGDAGAATPGADAGVGVGDGAVEPPEPPVVVDAGVSGDGG